MKPRRLRLQFEGGICGVMQKPLNRPDRPGGEGFSLLGLPQESSGLLHYSPARRFERSQSPGLRQGSDLVCGFVSVAFSAVCRQGMG